MKKMLDQVNAARARLQGSILDAVLKFEEETGLEVSYVTLEDLDVDTLLRINVKPRCARLRVRCSVKVPEEDEGAGSAQVDTDRSH